MQPDSIDNNTTTMTTPTVTQTTPYLLLKSARLLKGHLRQRIDDNSRGNPSLPYNLLAILSEGKCSVMELAGKLDCSKQEASRLIKQAQANNWVEVTPSSTDKRAKDIKLSSEGWQLLSQGSDLYLSMDETIARYLGAEDAEQLKQLLSRIPGSFEEK